MVLLALSLQDQVEKYGSYVGIAAFFGLAILSLLYFAQAREVKRLREWAGRAPERAREVEEAARAAADAARRRPEPAAVQQAPAVQPVAATAAGARSGTVSPAVPVGTATAVAERPDDEPEEEEAAVEGPVTADGKRPVAAVAPAAKPAPAEEDGEPEAAERDDEDLRDEAEDADAGDTDADDTDGAQPAAASAPTNGTPPPGAQPPVFPRPSTAAAAAGAGRAAGAPAAVAAGSASGPSRPAPAMPARAGAPSASPRRPSPTLPPRRPAPPAAAAPSHGGRRWAIAGGVVAVIAALGVYAATQLLGDDKSPASNQAATPTPAATQSASANGGGAGSSSSPPTRSETTVAVFNGTTINGLASQTADKLAGSGYKRGSTGDYTDQQRAASTVFYRRAARTQARNIGRQLSISDLRPMDTETQALAGDRADVAVVVGSDKAP
jgi:LytR cell envelope-related transcriptional attenuator